MSAPARWAPQRKIRVVLDPGSHRFLLHAALSNFHRDERGPALTLYLDFSHYINGVTTPDGWLQFIGCMRVTYLVGTVLSTLTLQVAGEVSMFTVLHNHHQWPCREREDQRG